MKKMDKKAIQRYERNLLVEGFSDEMQQCLQEAHVAVVGAGGLGSAVLSYLVACGVGNITIIDNDTLSMSNLQRQILYNEEDLGKPKAELAAARLLKLNPTVTINAFVERLTADNSAELLSGHNLILDCTDNYLARYTIDDYCCKNKIPMIYATAEGVTGQISIFNTPKSGSYRDLYPETQLHKAAVGVLSPIVGVVGSAQALEAVKFLTGFGVTLEGRLLMIDGLTMQYKVFEI